jgi:HrpA-like RNA helicase
MQIFITINTFEVDSWEDLASDSKPIPKSDGKAEATLKVPPPAATGSSSETELSPLASGANLDYDLIAELVMYIADQGEAGAILIFLPGTGEIKK